MPETSPPAISPAQRNSSIDSIRSRLLSLIKKAKMIRTKRRAFSTTSIEEIRDQVHCTPEPSQWLRGRKGHPTETAPLERVEGFTGAADNIEPKGVEKNSRLKTLRPTARRLRKLLPQAPRLGCHQALLIPEILEQILSHLCTEISSQVHDTDKKPKDASHLKDIFFSCRLVSKFWKNVIDHSTYIRHVTFQGREDAVTVKVPTEHSLERYTINTSFINWVRKFIAGVVSRDGGPNFVAKRGRVSKDNSVPKVEYWSIIDEFKRQNFPNCFFTNPPTTEATVVFYCYDRRHIEPAGMLSIWDRPANFSIVRTKFADDTDDYTDTIVVKNEKGVRVHELVDAIAWFLQNVAAHGEHERMVLEKLTIGVYVRYDKPKPNGYIGHTDPAATVDFDYLGESFHIQDNIAKKIKRLDTERMLKMKLKDLKETEE